jgi:type VI secretion system protein ImpM
MVGFRVKRVGYFGKMPKSGDFVSRNIDAEVKEGFDRWLQDSMSESRSQMKEAWLSAFLTAPVWRFLLLDQFGDGRTVLGVMIPSVDKVGRYFPLAVLVELTEITLSQETMIACDMILHEFEDLLLGVLSEELDQDFFDYQIGLAARKYLDKPFQAPGELSENRFHKSEGLTQQLGSMHNEGGSIWWSEGSDSRDADLLLYRGMPRSTVFASFLRNPNHFRDLEWAWDYARDLNNSQTDNPSVDLADKFPSAEFHLISHTGTDHGQRNTSAAVLSAQQQALVISDGRLGTGYFAMASRMLGRIVPIIFGQPERDEGANQTPGVNENELERVASFLATKCAGITQSALTSPISFAGAFMSDIKSVRLLIAGDYLCLHKGRHGVSQIFGARHSGEGPTITQDQTGHYKSVIINVEPGDRLLLSNPAFDSPYLKDDLYETLAAANVSRGAKSLWQNATIKGVPGNLVLAVLSITGPASADG